MAEQTEKKSALQKRIDQIITGQTDRAFILQTELKHFEKNYLRSKLKKGNVNDYVSLIKAQRLLVGMETDRQVQDHKINDVDCIEWLKSKKK